MSYAIRIVLQELQRKGRGETINGFILMDRRQNLIPYDIENCNKSLAFSVYGMFILDLDKNFMKYLLYTEPHHLTNYIFKPIWQ